MPEIDLSNEAQALVTMKMPTYNWNTLNKNLNSAEAGATIMQTLTGPTMVAADPGEDEFEDYEESLIRQESLKIDQALSSFLFTETSEGVV